jgi:hypothetical protein
MLKAHLKRNNALASRAASHCSNSSSVLLKTQRHTKTTPFRKRRVLALPSNGRHLLPCNQRIKVPNNSKGQLMQTLRLSLKLRSMANSPHQAVRRRAILHSPRLL